MIIYFIAGVLFGIFLLPILDSLIELLQVIIENKKGKYALDIAKLNKQVAELSELEKDEPIQTVAMGFHIPSSVEEEFDDDDDV